MDVEAKPAFASRNVEIEAAVAEVQVPRLVEGIVDGAHDLPIDMCADSKAADIAIARETPAVAELAVIAPAGVHRCPLKQPWVEAQVRRKSPGTKAEPGIGELHRVLEEAVKRDPGAG